MHYLVALDDGARRALALSSVIDSSSVSSRAGGMTREGCDHAARCAHRGLRGRGFHFTAAARSKSTVVRVPCAPIRPPRTIPSIGPGIHHTLHTLTDELHVETANALSSVPTAAPTPIPMRAPFCRQPGLQIEISLTASMGATTRSPSARAHRTFS